MNRQKNRLIIHVSGGKEQKGKNMGECWCGVWKDLCGRCHLGRELKKGCVCEECRCLGNRECEGSTVETCLACSGDSQEDCVALRVYSSDR